MPLQGVTNECALTQGVASVALGYALVGLSARPCLKYLVTPMGFKPMTFRTFFFPDGNK